ncbi:MAG: ATP-dependent sacrificial sulfur transferase LarE [Thermodesulfobacteriota bacterium]
MKTAASYVSDIQAKENRIREIIREAAQKDGVLIGFSGGMDSSLLLWESVQALGPERVIAVTATSPTSFPEELESAKAFAESLKVKHLVVPTGECQDPAFIANPEERCYICKRIRYEMMRGLGQELGISVVFDGTQADDKPEERPGMKAIEELGIRTPLAEAGVAKAEVRELLHAAGFPALAHKISQSCLATRIPTGYPITPAALERVRHGEAFLRECGLTVFRLRDNDPLARIATNREGMAYLLGSNDVRTRIVRGLTELGYQYVTLDLVEYG